MTCRTYVHNLVEIVVHRPELSDEERKKREAALNRALASYGRNEKRSEVR